MLHLSDVMKLQTNEKVLAVVRAHSVALVVHLIGYAALIILPCFFLFPLFHLGAMGIIVFLLPVIAGVFGAWRAVRMWDATTLIISDRRLIQVAQRGLWDRYVAEVLFAHVGDVQWEMRGLWKSFWKIGTIRIRTNAGSIASVVMTNLRGPDRVAQSIQELRGQYQQHHGSHHATEQTHVPNIASRREQLVERIQHADESLLEKIEQLFERGV